MKPVLKRTTIYLTAEQHEALRQLAFQRRTSMAELLRKAALEIIEDEEDIRDAEKAWSDTEGTLNWKQYLSNRDKK